MANKPNCYDCIHRRNVPGDAHLQCNNKNAKVTASEYGICKGWFIWPLNFDPNWLVTCDGFSTDPKDKLPEMDFVDLAQILFNLIR